MRQSNNQVTVLLLFQVLAHIIRVLNMVIIRKLALCKLCQNPNPVFPSDPIHADPQPRPLNNMKLLAEPYQLICLREPDIPHQPWEIALPAHIDRLVMWVVKLVVAETCRVDLELIQRMDHLLAFEDV
jgi:hypothetical protein